MENYEKSESFGKVLVTCPPMLGRIEDFRPIFASKGIELVTPPVVQTLSEEALEQLLPEVDGWIIGDDPATYRVFEAGKQGRLKAAVKWGVGVDNVDFQAAKALGIPVINTPQMFGAEVADLAINYVIGLARETYWIDREVRAGRWPKPAGISVGGRKAALIGFGDIGKAAAYRLRALELEVRVYDPYAAVTETDRSLFSFSSFPEKLEEADFVVVTCALNEQTRHLINVDALERMKTGVRIVNVSRGPIIDEKALEEGLKSGKVHSVALDVFETEPLPADSPLRAYPRAIFGTHNGSNTIDAVQRASWEAIRRLFNFLEVPYSEEELA